MHTKNLIIVQFLESSDYSGDQVNSMMWYGWLDNGSQEHLGFSPSLQCLHASPFIWFSTFFDNCICVNNKQKRQKTTNMSCSSEKFVFSTLFYSSRKKSHNRLKHVNLGFSIITFLRRMWTHQIRWWQLSYSSHLSDFCVHVNRLKIQRGKGFILGQTLALIMKVLSVWTGGNLEQPETGGSTWIWQTCNYGNLYEKVAATCTHRS